MRNKTFLLFIFISAIHATGIAQQDKIADSLLNVLKTQKEDTARVNTLIGLARNYYRKGEDSLTMKYANDVIAGSTKMTILWGLFGAILPWGMLMLKLVTKNWRSKIFEKHLNFTTDAEIKNMKQ